MYMFFIVFLIIISNSSRIYLILFYFTEVVFCHIYSILFSWLLNIWKIKCNRKKKFLSHIKSHPQKSSSSIIYLFLHVSYVMLNMHCAIHPILGFCKAVLLYEWIANSNHHNWQCLDGTVINMQFYMSCCEGRLIKDMQRRDNQV